MLPTYYVLICRDDQIINSICLLHAAPLKMSDLFRSRVLLNALRQESSRVAKKPIDDLKMVFNLSLLWSQLYS